MDTATQHTTIRHQGKPQTICSDLAMVRTAFANLFFAGLPDAGDRGWALIDTGVAGSAGMIRNAAETRFGHAARPFAIILTHGHFDHVGAVRTLASEWDAPVYAHPLELPYLTGHSPYPPPDPMVGGGAMAILSPLYPRGPIDLGDRVHPLPSDGTVPGMTGWSWIHTPGHSPGHVALYREADRILIAGDALVTTQQESALAVMTQRTGIYGPPAYFTPDWRLARRSVEILTALEPEVVASGHGVPLKGTEMRADMVRLSRDFGRLAIPDRGRYVPQPAITDMNGVVSVPPPATDPRQVAMLALGGALALGLLLRTRRH